MKTLGVVVFWFFVVTIPLTFICLVVGEAMYPTERIGYCKALDAEYVNSDPDFCLKGNSVVHFF